MLREFLRPLWIPKLRIVEIHDAEFDSVFHFDFAELMYERLPQTVLNEVIGNTF